ncbi:hypothetical protein Y1Q_0022018 [Alligator mississippiensis]|uniref:DDE Tnp4 domain-containing protein n=1 Tax=Alligator mississippiensis TaxID=8496 RepID=A0A151NLQ7_ALLMI|nr:hypothetical protein Y1Q_0022018 [Alligator mississippiensis]
MLRHMMFHVHNPWWWQLGFAQHTGALDGTHIPVTCLFPGDHPYYTWQGFYFVVLQAVTNCHSASMNEQNHSVKQPRNSTTATSSIAKQIIL